MIFQILTPFQKKNPAKISVSQIGKNLKFLQNWFLHALATSVASIYVLSFQQNRMLKLEGVANTPIIRLT